MIRPKTVIITETVIRDQQTNRMSLINIFEQFRSPGYPLLISRFTVFAIILRDTLEDPQAAQGRLSIRLDEEVLFEQQIEINFQNVLINRNVLQFQGFVLPRPGRLVVSVAVGDQFADSYPISVLPHPTPPPERIQA
jgi:hypothetical protein